MSQEGDARSAGGRDARGAGVDSAHMPEASLAGGNADVAVENLTIFSPTSVEVVFQWWVESNRRWAERNRLKTTPAA